MFASIVGIGIGNILMAFSAQLARFVSFRERMLGDVWLFILLVTFLKMFWNATVLAGREEWDFALFLYALAGPIVLLFASTLITSLLDQGTTESNETAVASVLTRFFWLFATSQAWVIGMDFVLGNGWITATTFSATLCVVAVLMAIARNSNIRTWFTFAMLLITLVDIGLQST